MTEATQGVAFTLIGIRIAKHGSKRVKAITKIDATGRTGPIRPRKQGPAMPELAAGPGLGYPPRDRRMTRDAGS